jgi:hypothetical protein
MWVFRGLNEGLSQLFYCPTRGTPWDGPPLDPATVVDVGEVARAVAAAELTRDRLQGALPRLRERWHEVALTESLAAWRVDYEQVGTELDEVAAAWNDRYPALVDELISLVTRAADVDRKARYIDLNAPPGAHERLGTVEVRARGRLMGPDNIVLAAGLRLPVLHRNGAGPTYAWPPPEQNIGVLMANMAPVPNYDADIARRQIDERNARMVADAARAATEDLARQRAREERERADIEAAKARDRQAHRERGWPPPLS